MEPEGSLPHSQAISTNCTLHISKRFVIYTVAVISNLYVDLCPFSRLFFWGGGVPLYVVVGPGWESLAYILTLGVRILMFKIIHTSFTALNGTKWGRVMSCGV